jgi:hypothetical protein
VYGDLEGREIGPMNRSVIILTPVESLAGAKLTQIRRPCKREPDYAAWGLTGRWIDAPWAPGDVLLGKEAWRLVTALDIDREAIIEYRADGQRRAVQSNIFQRAVFAGNDGWRSARSMPAWDGAVRYRYDVLAVRCERVQEITLEDARACGMTDAWLVINQLPAEPHAYKYIWDSGLSRRDFALYRWALNPFCWVASVKARKT